jgi:hypothetical protein
MTVGKIKEREDVKGIRIEKKDITFKWVWSIKIK